jgi:hypothetical protein
MRILPTRRTSAKRETRLVSIVKKIWYALLAILAAALVFEFEATWEVLQELVITAVEFIEQELEAFFSHTVGLSHFYAQMATAWTGLITLLTIGIVLIRRVIRISLQAKATLPAWREQTKEAARSWWQENTHAVQDWWRRLSLPRKVALAVAGVAFAVPLAWALAIVFATLITVII